jgi:hypothetical protein
MICIKPELIQKYIDKETTATERVFVEEHLKHCDACRQKVDARRKFSQLVVNSVNNMVNYGATIPTFVPVRKTPASKLFAKRRIIYGLSAACVLLLIMFTVIKTRTRESWHVNIVNTISPEVDANKPITKQNMIINIIDQEGNVTELTME